MLDLSLVYPQKSIVYELIFFFSSLLQDANKKVCLEPEKSTLLSHQNSWWMIKTLDRQKLRRHQIIRVEGKSQKITVSTRTFYSHG